MLSWLSSWRFLLSRRWVLFFLAIILVGWATWWLGEWQFGRLEDRKEQNAVVRANEQRDPIDVAEVLAPGREVAEEDQWRLVTATGEYVRDDTVVVRYRTRNGYPGVEVVVPLVTTSGTTLLVDRGWYGTDNPVIKGAELPAPPAGRVTVTGWVRADGTGSSTEVDDHSTRAIASGPIGRAIDREVYTGFLALKSEDPEPETELAAVELPDLGEGPHFFYGLQWWFFGVLAVGGFGYLAWDERRLGPRGERVGTKRRSGGPFSRRNDQRERSIPPSTGSITPETYDAAGDSTNAATRPNSSGSP
ncbi:SURF1 family cytochrome oxidase biogenesis protein [Nocardioides nitrophenolicus]|uniref:SURF1 family cytochrome oxidase biogenesis protein n=1 Tax=Nocardioides nitrophenolicus TaxID=60489 RepID=UPI0027DC0B5B|nr:SURF1 family protein [Nocardioides nitrophenolicus]MBM7520534.1 cytochrome oxidase assembly protein ShyY1 [Nocardioides nitrophenolicus]